MRQYETYKTIQSSVYKEAPISWDKYRVKDTVDKNTYYPVGDGDHGSIKPEMYQEEGIPYIRVQNLTWHGEILTDGIVCISEEVQLANKKSILYPGDILIAKTGATIGKLGLIPEHIKEANTTSSVGKLTVDKKRFNPKYILYCFQSKALQDQIWLEASQKSAQPGFNIDDLIVFEFLAPDLNGQSKIVEFLDHQTVIIDQLIQQKERLIELLKEKRQAVINEAVTKGLNPDAKMKYSGIECLGQVPGHWRVLKFRYLIDVLTDFTANGSFADLAKNVTYLDEGFSRLIRLTDLRENLENDGIYVSEESHNYLSKSALYGNEILLANVGAYAGLAWKVPNLIEPSTLGPNMFLLKFDLELNNDFAYFTLISDYLSSQLKTKAISSAQPKLNKEDVRSCLFVLPPIKEQIEITEYLLEENQKFDTVLTQETLVINKLKEYRQSMISEAVTGKIDVRDWQPNKQEVA